ncbi:hypothetical protein CT0861_10358 [Colletotrichum tofieldiae]|uniref:Heterokaryon incompatibility domain-containing protein n=1 Tax=Colletotrichum tofieldiae TaxID=708197 RepID=A0A166MZA3_9PEZI|nr:hypothetical protein CT0861_10358 [Colletotrichum tofieldiae]
MDLQPSDIPPAEPAQEDTLRTKRCRWCPDGRKHDWVCSFCENTSFKRPDNPLLCEVCQPWDDFTHVVFCQDDVYARIDTQSFDIAADGSQNYTQRDSYFDQGFSALNFYPLQFYSPQKRCILCSHIGRELAHLDVFGEGNAELAIWRPFPVHHCQPTQGISADEQARAMVEQCILPICLRTKSNGITQFEPLVLELDLHYELWGQRIQAINRWDRSYSNIAKLKQYLGNCTNYHDHKCNVPISQTPVPAGFRLIDAARRCVVREQEGVDYMALSYQWRTATACPEADIQLTKRNMDELERPHSLKESLIPEVISDAMLLCRDMGRRYLWVDRLCIVQDDHDLKLSQIQGMDTIYQQAFATIVACADGIGTGLPGLVDRPRQRSLDNQCWRLGIDGHYVGASMITISEAVEKSEWNTRAWTYQERLLSRRHIFFGASDVFFSCFHDEIRLGKNETNPSALQKMGRQSHGQGFETSLRQSESYYGTYAEMYGWLVESYTRRVMTYRSDILNAFDGVLKVFGLLSNTTIIFGVPERFMLQAILWGYEGTEGLATEPLGLPTWTWAAWTGQVQFYNHPLRFLRPLSMFHFGSLVSLFYFDTINGIARLWPLEEDRIWFNSKPLEMGNQASILQQILGNTTSKSRSGKDPVGTWNNCVHGPSNCLEHVDIDDDTRRMAEEHPRCLVFNTTLAFLRLRALPGDDIESLEPSAIRMGIYTEEALLIGETALMDRGLARRQFVDEAYPVFALAAGHMFKSADREDVFFSGKYPYFRLFEPWAIIVMIASRQGPLYSRLALGRVSPETWTTANPRWSPVILV